MKKNSADREFQVFIKPAGALCNLNCTYCYYIEKTAMFDSMAIMKDDILDEVIRRQVIATTGDTIMFSWHGGEPLLAGIPFFKKALALQKKYCPPRKRIINGIQTNGTLLNSDWAEFLARENFLVGLSMDGPEDMHDRYRKGKDGRGTFRAVLHAYDLLVMNCAEPEILCVVGSENSAKPLDVYRFFRQLGVSCLTFIPLVIKPGSASLQNMAVEPSAFGAFLCTIFDEWKANDIGKIKIQIIEEALRPAFNQDHTLCVFKKECGGVPVIEHNGDVFSCDHYVDDDHRLGNIRNASLESFLDSGRQKSFGCAKWNTIAATCRACDVLDMCHGECMKNRFPSAESSEPGMNYLCEGYKKFFRHIRPFANEISLLSKKRQTG